MVKITVICCMCPLQRLQVCFQDGQIVPKIVSEVLGSYPLGARHNGSAWDEVLSKGKRTFQNSISTQ